MLLAMAGAASTGELGVILARMICKGIVHSLLYLVCIGYLTRIETFERCRYA